MPQKTLFNKVIQKGISGATVGIAAGLILGLAIWGLETAVVFARNALINNVNSYGYAFQNDSIEPLTILGMSCGAIIGSISGIWTTIIEEKRSTKK